jgi:hypothetical protein
MPIPGPADLRIGNVSTLAQGIVAQLKTLQHAGPKDRPRMRLILRDRLQAFAEIVMEAADEP